MGKALNAAGILIDLPAISQTDRAAAKARADTKRTERAAALPKIVSGLAFLSRLTLTEYATILGAAAKTLAGGDPQISLWIDMLRVNGEINVAGADAVAAGAALVKAGLLSQERADAIFAPVN